MAKTIPAYRSQSPGLEEQGATSRYLFTATSEGHDSYWADNTVGELFESVQLGEVNLSMPSLSGSTTASSGGFTATYDTGGSGSNAQDGYTLATGTSSNNKCVLKYARRYPVASTKKIVIHKSLIQQAAIATSKIIMGMINTTTDPFTTPPTDGCYFSITNGAITGVVRGASGTAASTSTLATMVNGTLIELTIQFYNTGVAATSWGIFWVKVSGSAPVATPFSSAQITQLIAMTADLYNISGVQTTAASSTSVILDAQKAQFDR